MLDWVAQFLMNWLNKGSTTSPGMKKTTTRRPSTNGGGGNGGGGGFNPGSSGGGRGPGIPIVPGRGGATVVSNNNIGNNAGQINNRIPYVPSYRTYRRPQYFQRG